MKQYIKFLKFLWVILIVPSLYGMENLAPNNNKRPYSLSEVKVEDQEASSKKAKIDQSSEELRYGLVTESLDDCPDLINVVKQILKVDVSTKEDAEFLIMNVFRFAKLIRDDSEDIEGKYRSTNFIICDGQAYLNGGTNVTRLFDNFPLYDAKGNLLKRYKVTQLSDILGVDTKKLEAMRNVNNIYPKLEEWLNGDELDDKIKFSIRCFWNKTKNEKNDQRILDILQDDQGKYCKDVKSSDKLLMTSEYIRSLHTLGVDTAHLKCNEKGLLSAFWKSREAVREQTDEFLEKFKRYIMEFKLEDGKLFENKLSEIRSLGTEDYLEEVLDLWLNSEYRKYTHTEYLVQYQRKQDSKEETPLYMISLLDPCSDFCEEMLAKNTSGYKTIVISGCPFKNSRHPDVNQKRQDLKFVNRDVSLIQLDSDFYWEEKFKLWKPYIEKQIEIANKLNIAQNKSN
jgi:hypothetical protein